MHETIMRGRLFKRGMKVAIGASGGKGKACGALGTAPQRAFLQFLHEKLFFTLLLADSLVTCLS